MGLVEQIYQATTSFPASEVYGLTSQLRRAAVSAPSNIAEGAARNSKKDFQRFLFVTRGSLAEVETQLLIAGRSGDESLERENDRWEAGAAEHAESPKDQGIDVAVDLDASGHLARRFPRLLPGSPGTGENGGAREGKL
jgi:four helix bundle protein